jgi:hypothetical protein
MLFYIVLGQTGFVSTLKDAYWLVSWYQAGYFFLQPFNAVYFYISGTAGLLTAGAFCCIKPRAS